MDALGKGLESLIPNKLPEEIPVSPAPSAALASASADIPPAPVEEIPASSPGVAAPSRSFNDHFTPRRNDSVFWIEIEKIQANPYQPRREFQESALRDLASSIREHGVLQPILVSKREIDTPMGLEVHYELIAGERRWRAAQLAGLTQIPAVIRRGVPDDKLKLELAIIENVQREDLNAIERAKAFRQMADEFHMVQKDIAIRVGKSRELVANTMRLLALPEEIQLAVSDGRISEGHARAVLSAGDDAVKQFQVFNEIVTDRLSVREAESRARQVAGKMLVPKKRMGQAQDPEMRQWQNRLQERLGTKVQLQKMGDRGKIIVEFFSDEELRALLDKLVKEV